MDAAVSSSSLIYIQAVHAIASIAEERHMKNEGSSACVPPTLPLEFSELLSLEFIHLLSNQETRLRQVGMFNKEALDHLIIHEFDTLVRTVAREPTLEHTLQKAGSNASGYFNFSKAWSTIYRRFPHSYKIACGLASVLPNTATVEADFSMINYERDWYRSALTSFSLEGILHAKQFDNLKKVVINCADRDMNQG